MAMSRGENDGWEIPVLASMRMSGMVKKMLYSRWCTLASHMLHYSYCASCPIPLCNVRLVGNPYISLIEHPRSISAASG